MLKRPLVLKGARGTESGTSICLALHDDEFAPRGGRILSNNGFPVTLTKRQREVLCLLCEGLTNKLIGRRLELSEATVKCHVASLYRSLHVTNRLEAVADAYKLGLVRPINVESPWAAMCYGVRGHYIGEGSLGRLGGRICNKRRNEDAHE